MSTSRLPGSSGLVWCGMVVVAVDSYGGGRLVWTMVVADLGQLGELTGKSDSLISQDNQEQVDSKSLPTFRTNNIL